MKLLMIMIVLILLGLLVIYIYKESTGFVFTNYEIPCDKLRQDEVKVVLLTDLHNMEHGKNNTKLLEKIDEYKPDFVCFGGDIVNASLDSDCDYSNTLLFIKKLSENYKICYGIGNHEDRLKRRMDAFHDKYQILNDRLNAMNVPLMDNISCIFEEYGIKVYGLNLEHEYYQKVITKHFSKDYLYSKLGPVDDNYVNILLAHNPEHFKQYAEWGADIVFSGHVHGGIVRFPLLGGVISPAMKLFPKYDGGLFKEYGSVMVLSRGIGTHSIPIRINNKAEVVGVTFKKKDIT